MAYVVSARPPGGDRTWTVVDGLYRTVVPVEEWLEAHRQVWSPNTVRGYATGLAQWWTFLEQRDETAGWDALGVSAVSGFLSWLRNGRTVEHAIARDAETATDRNPARFPPTNTPTTTSSRRSPPKSPA